MQKAIMLFMLFTIAASFSDAVSYMPVDDGSSIKFKIKNLGLTVDGSFKGLNGNIEFDAAMPDRSKFDITLDANSINTGIGARDSHLRKEAYFDVAKYTSLKFSATNVTVSNNANTYIMYGNLTIKNISKAISFPFTATPQNNGWLFKGEFKINRRDYSVGGSSITLSDNLTVYLNVFAKKK